MPSSMSGLADSMARIPFERLEPAFPTLDGMVLNGIGEPLLGCASAALLCALSEAAGGVVFNRTPVVPDMILNQLAGRPQAHSALQVNCQ